MTDEELEYWGTLMDSQAMAALMSVADHELMQLLHEIYTAPENYYYETPEQYVANIKAIRASLSTSEMKPRVQALIDTLDASDHQLWHRPEVRGVFTLL